MKGLGVYQCQNCNDNFLGITALRKHGCYQKSRYIHTQYVATPSKQAGAIKYNSALNTKWNADGTKKT